MRKITLFRTVLIAVMMVFTFATTSGASNLISENISTWTSHASYGSYSQSITAGTVGMTDCIVAPTGAASGTGTIGYVQVKATTGIISLPSLSSAGTVEVHIHAGGAARSIKLQKFNGSTWDDLTTFTGIGTTGITLTYDVNVSSSVTLRLAAASSAVYVHDIIVTDYAAVAIPVVTSASPSGTVGVAFSYFINATNTPTSYAHTSGSMPDGLSLNTTTGEISGTPTTAGTPSIGVTATNAGGTSAEATLSFSIAAASGTAQTITFDPLSSKTYGNATFDLTATASSGLPVSYVSSNTAVATVSGATVTIVGAGSTTITASQAGNGTYNPATSVDQTLTVDAKSLTVTGAAVTSKSYDGTNAAVITGTLTGIVNSDDVTLTGTGTFADVNVADGIAVTSTSTLGGAKAANYTLTQPSGLTGNITKANQTITFSALPVKSIGDSKFKLTATASSSLTLTYVSSNLAVATIVGDSVTIVGEGTADITASQAGNSNYNAALDVTQTLTVQAAPILAWQFGTPASVGNEVTYDATSNNSNLNTSVLSRGAGVAAVTLANGFSANTWDGTSKATAVTNDEYYTFSINAKADYKVSLATLDVTLRRSSTGPNAYIWKYSLDGTAFTEIGSDVSFTTSVSGGTAQGQIDLSGIAELQGVSSATTITFRLYAWGATGAAGSFAIGKTPVSTTTNVLSIGGTVDSIPTGISSLLSSAKIYASKGQIVVTGVADYEVYNAQGMQVAKMKSATDRSVVSLRPGIYIVKAGGKTQKVLVK